MGVRATWLCAGTTSRRLAGILHWAADPHVDAGQLHKALDDALVADSLTPPLSEAIQLEYLSLSGSDGPRVLRDYGIPLPALPGGEDGPIQQLADWVGAGGSARLAWSLANNNVERSERRHPAAIRQLAGGVGAGRRATYPVAMEDPVLIYAVEPTAPVAIRAVAPERLARAIERNPYARAILFIDHAHHHPFRPPCGGKWPAGPRAAARSALILRLAAECYRREHGKAPATARALLGPYLKELPEGIATGDPIPTTE